MSSIYRFFSSIPRPSLSFPYKEAILTTLQDRPIEGLHWKYMGPFYERIAHDCSHKTMYRSQLQNLVREDFLNFVYPESSFDYSKAVDHVMETLKKFQVDESEKKTHELLNFPRLFDTC